jgi:hypothetical protein
MSSANRSGKSRQGGRTTARDGQNMNAAPFNYSGSEVRAVLQRTRQSGGRVYGRSMVGPLLNAAPFNYSGSEVRSQLQRTRQTGGRVYGVNHTGQPCYYPAPFNYSGNEVRAVLQRTRTKGGRAWGISNPLDPPYGIPTLRTANIWRRYRSQVHHGWAGGSIGMFGGEGTTTNNTNGIYFDQNWITNLCPNPGFNASTAGWSTTDLGTTLAQTNLNPLYGQQSGLVTTSGSIPGQGVYSPAGQFPYQDGLASASVSLWGNSGSLLVSLVSNPGGTVLASQAVVLNGAGYQTVNFNAIPYGAGCQLYILVTTLGSPQAVSFYIDGVMYTPDGYHLTPYIDGDQANCFWTGTPELSTSYQQFQFPISGALNLYLTGTCNIIQAGEVFQIAAPPVLEFFVDPQVGATATVASPAAAFTDFGIWELTDPDPAQTYAWWTNAGTNSSQTGYQQIYGMVVPPLDYQVSGGNYLWRRAAYAAVGFKWANVPTNVEQILTDVQLEYAKTSVGSATTPSSYQRPRQLQVVIKPSRLNYVTNPAFQNGTAGWSQDGTNVTTAVSNTVWPNNIATYDNVEYSAFQSCLVTLNTTADAGIQLSVPQLIPGQVYMASCYVMPNSPGITDLLASCGGGSADIASLINSADGYGVPPYGSGPYGGLNASNTGLATGNWTRISFPFVAATDTQTFIVAATTLTPTSFPQSFYVTAVLIESGDILMPYFDGNSGPDACWEYSGGTTNPVANGGTTPGTSRSYYYNQLKFGQGVVNTTMQSNTPLGISYATPLYATPPLQ